MILRLRRGDRYPPPTQGLQRMVNVQPFRGLRYSADIVGNWGAVLGPPYDIVDAAQTTNLKASTPYQIAHIETASGDDIDNAAQLLRDWRQAGSRRPGRDPIFLPARAPIRRRPGPPSDLRRGRAHPLGRSRRHGPRAHHAGAEGHPHRTALHRWRRHLPTDGLRPRL